MEVPSLRGLLCQMCIVFLNRRCGLLSSPIHDVGFACHFGSPALYGSILQLESRSCNSYFGTCAIYINVYHFQHQPSIMRPGDLPSSPFMLYSGVYIIRRVSFVSVFLCWIAISGSSYQVL